MAGIGSVQIDLEARLAKFESDIGRAARMMEREIARSSAMVERRLASMQKAAESQAEKIEKSFAAMGKRLAGFFAASAVIGYARQLGEVADRYTNIQAKVRLAAGENANLAKSIQQVYDVSQRTYNSFESTTALIQRTAGALRNTGRSYEESFNTGVRMAEVFNKALVVSGANAKEAESSALQFSQALVAGLLAFLRGEAEVPTPLAESLDSHRMAFAAERARRRGTVEGV